MKNILLILALSVGISDAILAANRAFDPRDDHDYKVIHDVQYKPSAEHLPGSSELRKILRINQDAVNNRQGFTFECKGKTWVASRIIFHESAGKLSTTMKLEDIMHLPMTYNAHGSADGAWAQFFFHSTNQLAIRIDEKP